MGELEEKREAFPAVVKEKRTAWAQGHGLGFSSDVASDLLEFNASGFAAIKAERDAARRLVKHREVETNVVLGGKDWVSCEFHWSGEPPDATYFDREDSETVRTLQLGVYAFGCPLCEKWWLRPMAPVIARFDGKLTVQYRCPTCVAQEGAASRDGRLLLAVNCRDFGFAVMETAVRMREGYEPTTRALVRFA